METSAAARATRTPRSKAKIGPPDEPWHAVVRHARQRPEMPYRENMYNRSFISRNCEQPDLAHTLGSGHPKARRATFFVAAKNPAKLKTLLTLFRRRGWEDCTTAWAQTLDAMTDGIELCPSCFHVLTTKGSPCPSVNCPSTLEERKAKAREEALAVGAGRAKVVDDVVVYLDEGELHRAGVAPPVERFNPFARILATRDVPGGQLFAIGGAAVVAVLFRPSGPVGKAYDWGEAILAEVYAAPASSAKSVLDGLEWSRSLRQITYPDGYTGPLPARAEESGEDTDRIAPKGKVGTVAAALVSEDVTPTGTAGLVDLPKGKVLATRDVEGHGRIALVDAGSALVVYEYPPLPPGSDEEQEHPGWVVRDGSVATTFRDYPDAYLQRVEGELKAAVPDPEPGTDAELEPVAPDDDGLDAAGILDLSWQQLQKACAALPSGAKGSRGDLLRRLADHHGVEHSAVLPNG